MEATLTTEYECSCLRQFHAYCILDKAMICLGMKRVVVAFGKLNVVMMIMRKRDGRREIKHVSEFISDKGK